MLFLIDHCLEKEKEKSQSHAISFQLKIWIYEKLGYRPAWGQNELTGLHLRHVITAMSKNYTMAQFKHLKK